MINEKEIFRAINIETISLQTLFAITLLAKL